METTEVIQIARDLLFLAVLLSAPVVGVSLLVGLLVSVLQTITSIQEQTLTFAPRIVAVAITIAAALPWLLRLLVDFTESMISRIGHVTL